MRTHNRSSTDLDVPILFIFASKVANLLLNTSRTMFTTGFTFGFGSSIYVLSLRIVKNVTFDRFSIVIWPILFNSQYLEY